MIGWDSYTCVHKYIFDNNVYLLVKAILSGFSITHLDDGEGNHIIFEMIYAGQIDMIKIIYPSIDRRVKNSQDQTIIEVATMYNKTNIIQYIKDYHRHEVERYVQEHATYDPSFCVDIILSYYI